MATGEELESISFGVGDNFHEAWTCGMDYHLAMVVVERGTSPNDRNDSWDIELHRMMVETREPVVTSWLNRE